MPDPAPPRLLSVVVSTYERPDALALVLRGLSTQQDRGFEVVVADDGSGPATRDLVEGWRDRLGAPLRHVWQPDDGFRAAEARNRAVLAAAGDYVVFLDGDCVPRPDFVARHRLLAEPGWFVAGNRILLSEQLTRDVLGKEAAVGRWPALRFLVERFRGGVNRLAPLVSLPDGAWRRRSPARWQGARTCNLAAWRADLDRVDGLDAAYQGWGLEDTDLAVRLMRAGVRRKDGRFATGVLHLWHGREDRTALPDNQRRLDAVLRSGRIRAERGLSAIAEEDPA